MTQLTSSVTPAQQQSMLGMAQLGTKQENDARQAGLAAKQLELQQDKLRVSEEQSELDRRLSRQSQALSAIEGERGREFQDGLVTKQLEGNKAQSILDSELREGVTKRQQERQVEIDQIRRRAELDAMDIDTTDLQDLLDSKRNENADMQMAQMEAEAMRQGKHEEFLKAKAKLAQYYEEQGTTFLAFEDGFGEAFDATSLDGVALLKKFGIQEGVDARIALESLGEGDPDATMIAMIGSGLSDFGRLIGNLFLEEDNQYLRGDRKLLKEGIDKMFKGADGQNQISLTADRVVSEQIGESIAIALGKSELADEIVSSVDLAIKAGRRSNLSSEDYRKMVAENLPEGVDPKAFFRGLEMSNRQFSQFARKQRRSEADGLQPKEVMSYAVAAAFKSSRLGEAVSKGPDIPDSNWHTTRANSLRSAQGRIGLESIKDPNDELSELMAMLDGIDAQDESIRDRSRDMLRGEREIGDLSRDNQAEINRREIDAARDALKGEDYSRVFGS